MNRLLWKRDYLIGLVLLLAFAIRFAAVDFGLPHMYHADEPVVVHHALAYGTGDWNPHFFRIPPLISYLLFIAYGFYFVIGFCLGRFSGIRDFEMLFYEDPTPFYLIARVLFGVVLGTLAVYALYRLARCYFSRETASISALFLATCFIHVRDSHYVYTDIPLVLVSIIAFYFFFKVSEQTNSVKAHVVSGCLIGVATAVKYNGIVLVVPYLAVALLRSQWHRSFKGVVLAGLCCLGTYCLLNPFSWIDFDFFRKEILSEAEAHNPAYGWFHHLRHSLPGGIGWPLLLMGVLGCLRPSVWKSSSKRSIVIFLFFYYWILKMCGQTYARYALLLAPFVLLLAADWMFSVAVKAGRWKHFVLSFLIVCGVIPGMTKSVLFDQLMARPDVRSLAKDWIESKIQRGSRIATDLEFYMPRLNMAPAQLVQKANRVDSGQFSGAQNRRLDFLMKRNAQKPSYYLYSLSDEEGEANFTFGKPHLPYRVEALKAANVEYVITVRLWEEDFRQAFYDQLDQEAHLVAEFNPYRDGAQKWAFEHPLTGGPFLWKDLRMRERNGQPIRIYRL